MFRFLWLFKLSCNYVLAYQQPVALHLYILFKGLAVYKGLPSRSNHRYNERSQMSSLEEMYVSKASAKQRQGRAGRVREGFCFRLYTKQRYDVLRSFTQPEIQRVALEELCLHIMVSMSQDAKVISRMQFDWWIDICNAFVKGDQSPKHVVLGICGFHAGIQYSKHLLLVRLLSQDISNWIFCLI